MVTAVGTENSSTPAPAEACSCCGRDDVRLHVRLLCHPEIALCDRCLLWLNGLRLTAARDTALGRLRVRHNVGRLVTLFRR